MGVKLGQKWAVKDGNLLASNQVGSRFFNKEFDFSRASNGTYVDRDGLLKTAELYNLVDYSEDFSQWTIQSGTTIESNTTETYDPNGQYNATKVTSNGINGLFRSALSSVGGDNVKSVYLKGISGGEQVVLKDPNQTNQTKTCTLTTEWQRFTMLDNQTSNMGIYIDDIPSSGVYIFGAQLVLGTEPLAYQYTNGLQGLPRISFEDGVGHLLLEPQKSNLLLQSNQFDTTWFLNTTSVTSGQSGIYGSNDAWLLNSTGTGFPRIEQTISASGVLTLSVYAKPATDGFMLIRTFGADAQVWFDLNNGNIVNSSGAQYVSSKTDNVGNGWYRCSVVFNGSLTSLRFYPASAYGVYSTSGNGIYIQHAQLEAGSYPTSTIETTTTSVTRLADVCNNSGSAQDFNSEEGVLYAEIQKLVENNDLSSFDIISINDNSSNNMIAIGFDNEDDVYARIRVGGVNIFTENSTFIGTNKAKLALKYKSGDIAVWLNGVEIVTNASGFTFSPNTLSNLSFDYGTSGENFYGKVRNLQVFTEALSDAELQKLTT